MKNIGRNITVVLFFIFSISEAVAQTGNVGIGTTDPNPKAMLDIRSAEKGVLIPRLTTAERNRIAQNGIGDNEINGLLIFNTDEGKFNYWFSSSWFTFSTASAASGSGILTGSGAPNVVSGRDGDLYFDTAGHELYGPKTPSGWGSGIRLRGTDGAQGEKGADGAQGEKGEKGETGDAGINGNRILSGASAPATEVGLTGDFFIDLDALVFYGPKDVNGWPPGVPLSKNGGAGSAIEWADIVSGKPTTLQGYGITDGITANASIAAGTYPKITFDEKGLVTKGETLTAADIPDLNWNKIAEGKPTTLQGYGITDGIPANASIAAGTFSKITYDEKGLVTKGEALAATDVPDLDWSKIVSGKPTTLAGYGITDGAALNFNINRPITRQGLTASGQNLGQGKTIAEFFEAFFFPSLAATPPTTTFTTPTLTFPYNTWKNWIGYTTKIDFGWSYTNNSKADPSDDKEVVSIKLKSGETDLVNVSNPATTLNGTFDDIDFKKPDTDRTTDFSKTFSLEVKDEQPNTVTKDLTLVMSKAIRLAVNTSTLTPATTVYEYSPDDIALDLNWSITPNDESITNIKVEGVSTGSTVPAGKKQVIFKSPENGGGVSQTFSLGVTGDIYSGETTRTSPAVKWESMLYRGVVTSSVEPCDPSFTFSDNQVKSLATTQLGGNWKSAGGYDFVCDASGKYIAFAYPDDNTAPTVQYFDANFNVWQTYPANQVKIIDRKPFVNARGYDKINYKIVLVCVQYKSATVKIRLQ